MKLNFKKIFSLMIIFALAIGTFGLIPLNVYVAMFPEFVVLIVVIINIALITIYFIFFKTKLVSKIILPVVILLFSFVNLTLTYCNPYWNSLNYRDASFETINYDEVLSYSEAKSDFKKLMTLLKKVHPKFRNGIPDNIEELYETSLDTLKAKDTITVLDLRREMQRVLHDLGDAHTTTYTKFDDKYLKTCPERSANGYSITLVNGMTISEVYELIEPLYCYEDISWLSCDLGSLCTYLYYGISVEPLTILWEDNNGNEITDVYTESDFVPYEEYCEINSEYLDTTTYKFVSYTIDTEKSLAVLTLKSCTYNNEYVNELKKMFTDIKNQGITNVAVDVRNNGGGNSTVVNEFIKYLPIDTYKTGAGKQRFGIFTYEYSGVIKNDCYDDLLFTGDVYVLTNSKSFSSAMMFAEFIQDNDLGKVIGKPSANAATACGDIASFRFSNSGLYVQISTKEITRADEETTDILVMPDYDCASNKVVDTLYEVIS